ncbi:MAG: ABC transporter substrate-binding protein [Actinomycetota bacterium]|nr:ABC transporter substrate-binding protein [Actinomycetota bacterium]
MLTIVSVAASSAPSAQAQNTAREVRIPISKDDGSLTPYTFQLNYPLVTLIYDTLMWRDRSGEPEPWLARSLRKSDAGKRITIRVRKGVRWHDGKPLTAEDVAFSFRHFAARFHPRFTPQLEAVERAQALNRETVQITLRHASPGFEDQPLSDLPILPRHLWEGLPAGKSAPEGLPVGSGPYRLVEYRRGKRYRFRENRGYFRGRPMVERIEVPFIGDFDKTVRALEDRRVDVIPVTLPERVQERLRRSVFEIDTGPLYTGTTLMFNLRRAPFDDPRARRAVSRALDLRRMARANVNGGDDSKPADHGYLHPESRWASPTRLQRFEPRRARSELAGLDLPRIGVMAPDNDPVRLEAGRQVVLALQRAGARAALRKLPPDRLAAAVGQDGASPSFEAAIGSSPALASQDPDFLRAVFGSGRRAPLNYSGYESPKFDRLAADVAAATNPETRRQKVQSELKLLAKDAPVIPLFFQQGAFAYRPQVYERWVVLPGTGILDKRSFLRSAIKPSRRGSGATLPAGSEGAGGGLGIPGMIALALAGIVLVLLALGLVGRRVRR